MYRIRYLRIFGYVSVSWSLLGGLGLGRVKVVQDGENELVYITLAYDNCPVTQHP